jgi:hypothetical protein
MAGVEKLADKVPGWVERLLIPTLESRVRTVVKEEMGHLEKTMGARFEATDVKIEALNAALSARLDAVNSRIDSLEKRIPTIQDIADLKARLTAVERRVPG